MFKRMPGESFDDALRRALSEGYEIKRVPHGLSREFFESMRAPMTVSIIRNPLCQDSWCHVCAMGFISKPLANSSAARYRGS